MASFLRVDLHIHTCLSPCAELEMLPELIVARAEELGLSMIAITDHNSVLNAASVIHAARHSDLVVLPGMEVQTREEVHVLALFDTLEQAMAWQAQVEESLPAECNDPEVFGEQLLLDAEGEAAGYEEQLLLTSCQLSIDDVVERVAALGGISIPAHVDRPAYSIIATLGFIPPDLGIAGAEISHLLTVKQARQRFGQLEQVGLIANSDAHRLDDMAARTTIQASVPTVAELARALAGDGERGVWIDGICATRAT